jgi:hypothetical protein
MTFTPAITLTDAITDPNLFGDTFAAESFWTWRVVAKLIDGLPLTEKREIELFEQCTGRSYNRHHRRAVRRLILLIGRRGGKDRAMSAIAIWRAALCANWRQYVSAGEGAVALLLGADKRQAAILSNYCNGLLEKPLLAAEVVRRTNEVIEFANGASLEISTNDARLVRGRSAIAVLGSEACHWRTDEASSNSDTEVVGAAEPSLSMCPDGGLLALGSSVHRTRGYMHAQWRKLWGVENPDDETLVWFAGSKVMNPRLPQQVIDAALSRDTQRARAEFENVWRDDLSGFLDVALIEAAVDSGVMVRPPRPGVVYTSFCDPSGGVADSFTAAVAHVEGDVAVLDNLLEIRAPFNPTSATQQVCGTLRAYGLHSTTGDKYAAAWTVDAFAKCGVKYEHAEQDRSALYLNALPLFTAARTRLLDNKRLVAQFGALERRTSPVGKDRVDHGPGGHDDLCNAAAGALVLAVSNPAIDWGRALADLQAHFRGGFAGVMPGDPNFPNRWNGRHLG